LIVMKFGGTSVADAERIGAVAQIVARHVERRPVVIVSALAGVTDLLVRALRLAAAGEHEPLEPVLAEAERIHRWAIAGSVEEAGRRHDLNLEVDRLIDDLRRRLRSIRILGEATPRAADAVLAFGEDLASRIVSVALRDRGIPTHHVDARRVLVTDARFGTAEPDLDRSRDSCRRELLPPLERSEVPVLGGFVGSTVDGETTTLGRGGSDKSAAIAGLLLSAEEIQIWTDVDGLMSADPRLVPAARRLERLSFAEAAELACNGASVLHPDSIAPAVRERIPVRVMNSMGSSADGTLILGRHAAGSEIGPVAVASRRGVELLRVRSRGMRADARFLPDLLRVCADCDVCPELFAGSAIAATLAVRSGPECASLESTLGAGFSIERQLDRATVWVVGSGLEGNERLRRRIIEGLSRWDPEMIAAGVSATSIGAVVTGERLEGCVRELHRNFFEETS